MVVGVDKKLAVDSLLLNSDNRSLVMESSLSFYFTIIPPCFYENLSCYNKRMSCYDIDQYLNNIGASNFNTVLYRFTSNVLFPNLDFI